MPWKEVTDAFSERQRHYKDTYLEIDQVYFDEKDKPVCEVSLFRTIIGLNASTAPFVFRTKSNI